MGRGDGATELLAAANAGRAAEASPLISLPEQLFDSARHFDFLYHTEVDYNRERDPRHDELCADDYCRCSRLTDARVTRLYDPSAAALSAYTDLASSRISVRSRSGRTLIKPPQQTRWDQLEGDHAQRTRELLALSSAISSLQTDDFYVEIGRGYYGEEIEGVSLEGVRLLQTLHQFDLTDDASVIRESLKLAGDQEAMELARDKQFKRAVVPLLAIQTKGKVAPDGGQCLYEEFRPDEIARWLGKKGVKKTRAAEKSLPKSPLGIPQGLAVWKDGAYTMISDESRVLIAKFVQKRTGLDRIALWVGHDPAPGGSVV